MGKGKFGLLLGILVGVANAYAVAQATSVPREVLFLSATAQEDHASGIADAVRERFELPLNHLGMRVRSRNLRDGEPRDVDPSRVRAVVLWFRGDETPPRWLWPWLWRQARHDALRFVHLGSLVPLGLDARRATGTPPLTRWLERFGFAGVGAPVEDELRVEVKFDERCAFEARPIFRRAHLGPWSREDRNNVWLTTYLRGKPDEVRHPVATGSWGGLALAPFVFDPGSTPGGFRWHVDPFRFFHEALGLPGIPVPDPCVRNGRRVFTLHVGGAGFDSPSVVTLGKSCAEVFLAEIVDRFRLPMTVSVTVGGLTDDLGVPQPTPPMLVAREIFQRAWVDPATDGVSRRRNWRGDAEAVYPNVRNFVPGPMSEVREAVRFVNDRLLEGQRKCAVFVWSGLANPSEELLATSVDLGVTGFGGGRFRFDGAFASVGFVSPWSIQVGDRIQVLGGAADEDAYQGFHAAMPGAFRHVDETIQRTGSPRILTPVGLHAQFLSAGGVARLRALQERIRKWVVDGDTIPVRVSDYVRAVRGARRDCEVLRTAGGWQLRGFADCGTVRVDGERRHVDWDRSRGVVGARRIGDSYYLQLATPDAELVFRDQARPRPHVVHADIEFSSIVRTKRGLRWRCESARPRTFVFGGFPPNGALELVVGKARQSVVADDEGRYRFTQKRGGTTEIELRLR